MSENFEKLFPHNKTTIQRSMQFDVLILSITFVSNASVPEWGEIDFLENL